MKSEYRLIKAFGQNEFYLADMPPKVSGIRVRRITLGSAVGCSYCFPHGF